MADDKVAQLRWHLNAVDALSCISCPAMHATSKVSSQLYDPFSENLDRLLAATKMLSFSQQGDSLGLAMKLSCNGKL